MSKFSADLFLSLYIYIFSLEILPLCNYQVDGERTLHENVADHGALKATIAAYKDLQNIKKEPKLKDFESFSHLRLLTLAFAVVSTV